MMHVLQYNNNIYTIIIRSYKRICFEYVYLFTRYSINVPYKPEEDVSSLISNKTTKVLEMGFFFLRVV